MHALPRGSRRQDPDVVDDAATPSAKRARAGTADSAHEKRAATARATSSGPWSGAPPRTPATRAVCIDAVIAPRSVAGRGEGLAPGGVRAGQLEPVLGGVDERREHPEVARHQGAVRPGPLSLEPRERRRDVLPAHGDQVARDVDVGVLAGATARSTLRMPGPGSRQDHRGVGLLAGDDAGRVDVDVGTRSVGGGQPGAQERGMTGPVEDAATVEDTDRLVVGAVRRARAAPAGRRRWTPRARGPAGP